MAVVYLTNVQVRDNPASMETPFAFEISFESLTSLKEDLEFKLVYVGSADDKSKDQELDCVALSPVNRGALQFVFVADPPDYTKIDREDLLGITVILLSGLYKNQEFVRVGWYLQNALMDEDAVDPDAVETMDLKELLKLCNRTILAENPRVTKFNIDWDNTGPSVDAVGPRLSSLGAPTPSQNSNLSQPPDGAERDTTTRGAMIDDGEDGYEDIGDLTLDAVGSVATSGSTLETADEKDTNMHCDKNGMSMEDDATVSTNPGTVNVMHVATEDFR